MNIDNLVKVRFYSNDEQFFNIPGLNIDKLIESNISLGEVIKLSSQIEKQLNIKHLSFNATSKSLHNPLSNSMHYEAYEGLDYKGDPIYFNSYVCWEFSDKLPGTNHDNLIIYKYNFENYIPFKAYHRNEVIDNLFGESTTITPFVIPNKSLTHG